MLMTINGRRHFFPGEVDITKDRPGHWSGTVAGHAFKIEGGRAAGGTAREWFVECPDLWHGSIETNSLVQSITLLVKC